MKVMSFLQGLYEDPNKHGIRFGKHQDGVKMLERIGEREGLICRNHPHQKRRIKRMTVLVELPRPPTLGRS